tara:strand:+ start:6204 stop:7490 length:1287 start_codon:yes stop_codon:yes gene_type:complete
MAKTDQNTYVEPVSTVAIATARLQQNRSYRSLLANFSSNVAPSIGRENYVVDGAAIAPPDGTLFHLANSSTSALYVHDERSSLFTKSSDHPLTGTKFTRYGITRAEASYAQMVSNSATYEVGEMVTVFDSSNARLYIAKSDTAGAGKFIDPGIPPTNNSVTNVMIGFGTGGGNHGITPDRMNVAWEFAVADGSDPKVTLALNSFAGSGASSGRTGNIALGFNSQNSVHNAAIVYYGAGTGGGSGVKAGLRITDKSRNLAPIGANLVLQSTFGATASTTGSNDLGPICPPGSILIWAGAALPDGWLECNGATVSQSTYAALWLAFGEAHLYGSDPGSGNFILPDLRDRFPLGKGTNNSTLGQTNGSMSASNKLTTDSGTAALTLAAQSVAQSAKDSSTVNVAQSGSVTGSGHTHTATVPSVVLRYIIKT